MPRTSPLVGFIELTLPSPVDEAPFSENRRMPDTEALKAEYHRLRVEQANAESVEDVMAISRRITELLATLKAAGDDVEGLINPSRSARRMPSGRPASRN